MKIVFLHRRDTDNVGDLASCPAKFLKFPEHTVRDPLHYDGGADLLIVGGGGLMGGYFDRAISKIVENSGSLVLWGVGSHYETFRMAEWASKAEMIGIRDDNCGEECVPCASCLSSEFDVEQTPVFNEVGYYHNHRRWRPSGIPAFGNHGTDLKKTLTFLRSGKLVRTNSYHGVYWAKLLQRHDKLVERWNSKFDHIPNMDLEQCRERNLEFYNRVVSRFNLTV